MSTEPILKTLSYEAEMEMKSASPSPKRPPGPPPRVGHPETNGNLGILTK